MKKYFLSLLVLILMVLVGACTQRLSPQPPADSLEVVNLQIEPAIEHWLPEVARCGNQRQDFGIYTQVLPHGELNPEKVDLVLRLGQQLETDPFVAIMGFEELIIVAGKNVPVMQLSKENLQAIFSGSIENWSALTEIVQEENESNQPIITLSYPDKHVLRILFEETYLDDSSITSNPQVFSTDDTLQIFLRDNPYAIGYTLKSQVPPDMKTLSISNFDSQFARHFVLAVTPEEPEGELKQFLLCLQNSQ